MGEANDRGDQVFRSRAQLPKKLSGLEGDELIAALVESGEGAILEAMWFLNDESVRVRLVSPFATSEVTHLSDLLVHEALSQNGSQSVCQALVALLDEQLIDISAAANRQLAARLLDATPFVIPAVERGRALLEQQVLSSEDDDSLEFALAVVRNQTSCAGDDAVRNCAFDRLKSDLSLLKDIVLALADELSEEGTPSTWNDVCRAAAAMVECDDADQEARTLAEAIILTCPAACPSETLDSEVQALIHEHGLVQLRRRIEVEPLPNRPGSRALLRTIEGIGDGRKRAPLFVAACVSQTPTYVGMLKALAGAWSDDEWNRRLRCLARSELPVPRPIAAELLQSAPFTAMAASVQLAVMHPCPGDEPALIEEAAAVARAWLQNETPDDEPDSARLLSTAFYWPKNPSPEVMHRVGQVLTAAVPSREWEVVVPAFLSSALTADIAVSLLLPGQYEQALRSLGPCEQRRMLCQGLAEWDPDGVCVIVGRMQSEGFSLDLCQACAPVSPDDAFVGGDRAWGGMSDSDRDAYCQLLCSHGTPEQFPLLFAVVADSRRQNSDRRCQATAAIAQLTPKGGEVPAPVLDLLDTGVPRLMLAATEAVGAVCPASANTLRRLRQAAANGGIAADSIGQALAGVEGYLLHLLEAEPGTEERVRVLEALGVCGSERAVLRILDHIGPAAEDTHLPVRVAAAQALAENCLYEELSIEALERLALLLDGEAPETHNDVRESLSMASLRANLGDDAALAGLYDMIDFTPRHAPDELFGREKASLVRQLTLLAQEEKRGPAGWGAWLAVLDTVAERLVRAAYLRAGVSESLRERIARGVLGEPAYGELLQALSSVSPLVKVKPFLQTVHSLRCTDSEIPHAGERPKEETIAAARIPFQKAARRIVGLLDTATT